MIDDAYSIRRALPADLAALPAIERAAAVRFRSTPYAHLADDDPVSGEVDLAQEHVWLVDDPHGQPVGFAIVRVFETSVHLHELDLLHEHAGRGLGRRLIDTVAEWARGQGALALTLTTFVDVPWNGPYYARLGFRALSPDALSPALRAALQGEADAGLPRDRRIAMQRDL